MSPLDILTDQIHTIKLIASGKLAATLTPRQAAHRLSVEPERYRVIASRNRVRKIIDTAPAQSANAYEPCYRNTAAPIMPPGVEWIKRMGYEVRL